MERQIKAERNEASPLLIFAEGATTNGTALIEFKKGAFMSLRKVKPHFCDYWTLTGAWPVHGDAISLIAYLSVVIHCGLTLYTVNEMPVFEPNEFFWDNNWDGKEEKW